MSSPTGRLPQGPALQSIPIRTEVGRQIREAFTREEVLRQSPALADVDYEALELLALASLFAEK